MMSRHFIISFFFICMKTLWTLGARTLRARTLAAAVALVGVGGLFSLTGCQTGMESLEPAQVGSSGISSVSSKNGEQVVSAEELRTTNAQLEEIAKSVAVVVAEKETAAWLHKKCMEKFDGETNVLWQQLDADTRYPWADKVILKARNLGAAASKAGLYRAMSRVGEIFRGNVHIYWHNAEEWDGQTTPVVAYTPLDDQLGKRVSAPGFDARGTALVITEDVMKKRPVLVITRNERTDASGKVRALQPASPKQAQGQLQSVRNCRLRIHRTQFSETYEDIFSGAPDFAADIMTTVDGNTVTKEYSGFNLFGGVSRADCNGGWVDGWVGGWDRNFGWDSTAHKTLYIQWYEYDPPPIFAGAEIEFSLEADFKIGPIGTLKPGVKFKFKLPTTLSTQMQGWAIHYDDLPMPGTTIRALYNGGNPSIEFKFDPLY
jgi:hypothetical protein